MAKPGKKRVSITVDSDLFDRVSALLDEKGFPRGALSSYLDHCIQELEGFVSDNRINRFPSALFHLEVSRVGLKAAADLFNLHVEGLTPEDERPLKR